MIADTPVRCGCSAVAPIGSSLTPLCHRHAISTSPPPRHAAELSPSDLPATESLKETVARFLPAWDEVIAPTIRSGKRVIIAAHGNSLRALIKHLDGISDRDIVELNIPTGAQAGICASELLVCLHGRNRAWQLAAGSAAVDVVPLALARASAAIPLVYELDADLKPVRHYYLADEATVKAKIEAVAKQGSAAGGAGASAGAGGASAAAPAAAGGSGGAAK